MRLMLVASMALLCAALPARADWPLDKMNAQIDATSVIVSGICSGTIIDVKERLILTANHCITDNLRDVEKREVDPKTGEIRITHVQERTPMYIETWKRQDFKVVTVSKHFAEIKGYDAASDTALLQVIDVDWVPEAATALASDDYPYLRGQTVYAVGNPAIEFDNSITMGIISAPARSEGFGTGYDIPLFQHSANTIGGNSGGAIYNEDGELIGTVTGGVKGSDVGLAVPVSFSKALIRKSGFGKILERK